jgi:hypothetical protein
VVDGFDHWACGRGSRDRCRAAPRPRRRPGGIERPIGTPRSRSAACRRALPSAGAATSEPCPGVGERLGQVDAAVHAHKAAATGSPPIAVLGGMFRFLARLGGYRFYMNHQHRFHTLVTHVRGPGEPVRLDGHEVSAAIPVAVAEGGKYHGLLRGPVVRRRTHHRDSRRC